MRELSSRGQDYANSDDDEGSADEMTTLRKGERELGVVVIRFKNLETTNGVANASRA